MVNLFKRLRSKGLDFETPAPVQRSDEGPSTTERQTEEVKQQANPRRGWYDFIEEETRRNPISHGDRLDALSSKAREFASSYRGDEYTAGMWHGDLLTGLLWHDSDFEASDSEPTAGGGTPLQKPVSSPRGPSWTWASLDGSIRFLHDGTYGPESLVRNLRAHTLVTTPDGGFGSVLMRNGTISLTGQIREITGLRGFNEAFAIWMSENRPQLGYDCTPDISADPDYVFDCTKYVLPLVRKRCDPRCRHSTGCDKDPMVYGLVLHFVGQGPQFDALPGVMLARQQCGGQIRPGVEVFMRCGVIACYMSSFENVPWQDAIIT